MDLQINYTDKLFFNQLNSIMEVCLTNSWQIDMDYKRLKVKKRFDFTDVEMESKADWYINDLFCQMLFLNYIQETELIDDDYKNETYEEFMDYWINLI